MGGNITKQDVPVFFPESLYRRMEDAQYEVQVRFLNETIHEIIKLFDENMDAVTWEEKKLDDFLILLHRQFQKLKSCVSPAKKAEGRLESFFKKLNKKVLKEMNYSAQAWELIRKETKYVLEKLYLLVATMHR
ncbi:interferon a3 [Esox lucius]|nr:interferon a3 [Esox lucius]